MNRSRPASSRPNSSSIPRALNALHDTSEEEDEESSPVLTQTKNTKASLGSSPPPYGSGLDRGGTSSSGASGAGAPTAPLNVNKNGKKEGEEDKANGKNDDIITITYVNVKL